MSTATGQRNSDHHCGRSETDFATAPTAQRGIHQVVAEWVRRRPESVALRMVGSAGTDVWTYRQFWDRVCHIRDGAFSGFPSGSRVVMARIGDADYVAGFVAAMEAGLIPVPLYLPSADAPERFLRRADYVLRDCAPAAVYTSSDLVEALGRDPLLDGLALLTPDSVAAGSRQLPATAAITPEHVAFLQYTSGSTGQPKGIVNTHETMLCQLGIGAALWNRPEDIHTVSWLPLYHDLGIFWGVMLALTTGGTATLIPPFDFVKSPRIWLETIHAVRGNWTAGPDFAYRLCLDAFDEAALASLDLSCLHLAINGAEPVRAATLREFTAKFAPAGLRADVMAPQYGLAEAGLAVSGTARPRPWVQATFDAEQLNRGRAAEIVGPVPAGHRVRTLISCGDSTFGWDVRIVDPGSRVVLSDGDVGEIWVGGAGLPNGYWRQPELTAETFGATTADGMGPYLRTGDAGFRSDGELYICGRFRDLIIVGGGNYFPNDIELTVEEAPCGVDSGGACAVQPQDSHAWWLVAETAAPAEDLDDLSRVLRRRILAVHQTAPERIVWVRPRVLPRTTSGKIRRRKTLDMLDSAKFDVVHEVSISAGGARHERPTTEPARFVAGLLGVDVHDLELDSDLTTLGLTSMMTAQVVQWFATMSRQVNFADLYADPTLRTWQRLFDSAPTIPARDSGTAGSDVPTTALQRAYWIGRDPAQPLGGVGCQTYFELSGATIDPDRLDAALGELVRRHPMLRSSFPDAGRCHIGSEAVHAPLRVHDLTEVAGTAHRPHLDEVRNRLRRHRFGIESGDTWRVELTRLPDRCILHFAIDLIIADLSSIDLLLHDLAALYRGDRLPAVGAGCSDLVRVPTAPSSTDNVERLPECPPLPLAEERAIAFAREQHTLSAHLLAALDEMCRAHGVTRAAVFLAAYTAVLHRWSNSDEFLVNVTTFGRPPDAAEVIGDFTATHLYRAGMDTEDGFADLVRRVQQGLRAALTAPESTDLLAAQLQAGTGHSGIAPVVFTYAAATTAQRQRDIDTLGALGEVSSMTPQVLIDNQIGTVPDASGGLIVSWDYRASCFPPGVVTDMFGAYVGLLEHLGNREWSTAARIELPQRSRLIRRQRNATAAPRADGLLYDAFRRQVQADPGRVALRWAADEFNCQGDGDPIAATYPHLSYGHLDELARRVAGVLAERHAPGSVIGIRLAKSPAQVVAVLGVMMAGCSYLPIGVDQPGERFERICSLSGMAGLIGSPELLHSLTAAPVLHDLESLLQGVPRDPIRVDPDDTAYVIYTSGSTGQPKGVLISHAAALNTVHDVNQRNGIGCADALLAISALDFDLSVYDIFGPLSCGASLVIISERSRRDAFRWRALITEFKVTVWDSVPPLLDMLLIAAGDNEETLPSLQSVFLSGDWIPLTMPSRLHRAAPNARLVAMGGATEAAIWSNEFVLPATGGVDPAWVSVPYGYPLSNQRFRVVDNRGRDCPDYVAGEMWIGGAGVAQGYLNAPDMTAERFVVDEIGDRWYRTGDLGCYWRDGTLQFLGRIDSQVKIGGHRVECGEVEHALRGHALIDSAAVVPIHGNAALGAVVVCSGSAGLTDAISAELRAYLATRLPHYMVPRHFVRAAELPLTGNGKVDRRRAVREVESAIRTAATEHPGAELSTVEQLIADTWSVVLGQPVARRDDNFFAHGGDSLRATQVAADLKRRGVLGAEVGQLLRRPTLGEFAAGCVIGAMTRHPAEHVAGPAMSDTEFPLTRLQQAYVLGSAGLNGSTRAPTHFAIVLGVDATDGRIDLNRFVAVVTSCVEEFAVLRCGLESDTGQRVHRHTPDVRVELVDAGDPDTLLLRMTDGDFDPREVPVITCFTPSGSARYVGLLINYLSLDARSLATVIATIIADYQQTPRPRRVDPSADVFVRFASEKASGESDFDVACPPPTLPLRDQRPDSATRVGFQRCSFTLSAGEFTGLRDRAAQLRVTPTALIFEAFTAALHAGGAGDRFAVVVPMSHRPGYAPADREVLGNFTRLALCEADYGAAGPGSPEAVAAAQQQLWRAVGSGTDATGHLAALRARGSAGYPVVFTSTLGLVPQSPAQLSSIRTMTQTPGVWLDCQIEDDRGAARISWDTATNLIAEDHLAAVFSCFRHAVHNHAEAPAGEPDVARAQQPLLDESDWAAAVIAAAGGLCAPGHVRPEYAEVVRRWQQLPLSTGHDTARAAGRLADIVTGAASAQTLIGDPRLAPEAMLLAEGRLQWALDDLTERIFGHARAVGRRLRILEVGSRTGLVTQRLTDMIGAVVADYLCFEPNPVLADIAAGRKLPSAVRHIVSPHQIPAVAADVVICCGSLHQLPDAGAVLDALTVTDTGWLWAAEICEITAATLASAAVLNPGVLLPGALRTPDQWWRFIAQHGWQPGQMTQDGAGLTIVAQPRQRISPRRAALRSSAATPAAVPAQTSVADQSVQATIAEIWRRHLNLADHILPSASDDFFLLGGDSLVATRVYADLRTAGFGRLALVDLFNYPLLGELAAHAGAPGTPPPTPAPPPLHSESEVPLTVVQHAYLAGREGGFMLSGVAAHCYFEFEVRDFDRSRFEAAARRLVEHHPGLRTTVTTKTDGAGSRLCATVHPVPIEPVVCDHPDVRGRMRDQVIDLTTRPGIDFGVQAGVGDAVIGISMDNVMLDGTSMMIALAQLDYLYRGGDPAQLPTLQTTFAQYVRDHPELWPGADESVLPHLAAGRDYWRARLPSLPPAPRLAPTQVILDIGKPVFDRVEAVVARDVWTKISQACRTERVTAASFLLANYARVLAGWAGTTQFCINVTLFDRDPGVAGIQDVIGDFTSLLLLECRVDADLPIWEQARRLQRQLLTDLPHRTADAVWLQRELLRHHGQPANAVFPVVFTSGLGLIDTSRGSSFELGSLVYGLSQTPQTVLDFQMWENAGSLALSWDFVTQAISADVARTNLDALVQAMVSAVATSPAPNGDDSGAELLERVLQICAVALNLPRVQPGQNFFQLGGDSVTATRVVEQISREIAPGASMRLLFENPVIGEFAARLKAVDHEPAGQDWDIEEGVL